MSYNNLSFFAFKHHRGGVKSLEGTNRLPEPPAVQDGGESTSVKTSLSLEGTNRLPEPPAVQDGNESTSVTTSLSLEGTNHLPQQSQDLHQIHKL